MTSQRETVDALMKQHARLARQREADRSVSIAAVSAARRIVLAVPEDVCGSEYSKELLSALDRLITSYHGPDGESTVGRGVIGTLVNDIRHGIEERA